MFISLPVDAPSPQCPLCSGQAAQAIAGADGFLHCPDCDLRYLHPSRRLSREAELARYQTHNNDLHDPGYRAFLTPLANALAQRVQVGSIGLDFGCGPGPLLAKILTEAGMQMELHDPYFHPTPVPADAQFDFIVSSEVVEHLFFPDQVFRQLHHWLKPGGWLGIMTALVTESVDFANWYYRRDPTHVVFYSEATFAWLVRHHGWSHVIRVSERIILLQR